MLLDINCSHPLRYRSQGPGLKRALETVFFELPKCSPNKSDKMRRCHQIVGRWVIVKAWQELGLKL
jgi:hypothetical protein